MPSSVANPVIAELRERIRHLEGAGRSGGRVLPFGVDAIDRRLPGGGLMLGCLHEVADGGNGNGGGSGIVDGAAALFAAGIAARMRGRVLWCVTRRDLFAPALAQAGLAPDRVIHVEAGDERDLLACFEEGLRHGEHHGGLSAVVAEVTRLSMTASRRLQLAAERSGAIGIAIRRWRRPAEAAALSQPTAAFTRWRVSVLPSVPLPVPGVGRSRWRLELVRCRGGEGFEIDVEACDAEGRIAADRVAVPAAMADGPSRQTAGRSAFRSKGTI